MTWRPFTAIRWRTRTAIRVHGDPDWLPLVVTPSHPEYPAGHPALNGAAASVLLSQFVDGQAFSLTTSGQPGRTYAGIVQARADGNNARVWGGMHYPSTVGISDGVGEAIGEYVSGELDAVAPKSVVAARRKGTTYWTSGTTQAGRVRPACGGARCNANGGIDVYASGSQTIPATLERQRSGVRRMLLVAAIVVLPAWMFSGTGSGAGTVVTAFDFTGAPQAFQVPSGVCRIRIEVVGAAGGSGGTAGAPGAGAAATAELAVTPGETLRVRVGGSGGEAMGTTPGAGGWNGGGAGGGALDPWGRAGSGGGGATDVRRGGDGLAHRIIVGAGGSGGAGGAIGGPIGMGGGNGGDLSGHEGFAVLGSVNPATGGEGGTQTAGGNPGRNGSDLSVTATAGALGFGGSGAAGLASGGGGGGGGLYGGGGGGSSRSFSGGHGGGGSGFGPRGAAFRVGVGGGFGRATISYDPSRC